MRIPEISRGLHVTEDTVGDMVVVHVAGEVDILTAADLATVLCTAADAAHPPGPLVIDLTGTRFFSAAGLTLLIATQQRCRERQLTLRVVATHRSVLRPLQITGLDRLLDITLSLDVDGLGPPLGESPLVSSLGAAHPPVPREVRSTRGENGRHQVADRR